MLGLFIFSICFGMMYVVSKGGMGAIVLDGTFKVVGYVFGGLLLLVFCPMIIVYGLAGMFCLLILSFFNN